MYEGNPCGAGKADGSKDAWNNYDELMDDPPPTSFEIKRVALEISRGFEPDSWDTAKESATYARCYKAAFLSAALARIEERNYSRIRDEPDFQISRRTRKLAKSKKAQKRHGGEWPKRQGVGLAGFVKTRAGKLGAIVGVVALGTWVYFTFVKKEAAA